jgi:hypothetical protein
MAELNAYIERLCLVPMATRRFVGKVGGVYPNVQKVTLSCG